MPLTPVFSISQDATTVFVEIEVPYLRTNNDNTEIFVDSNLFSFFCKPYLLKLTFPAAISDDENCKAVYDPLRKNGVVTCHLQKKQPGEFFPDLDLISNLLQKKKIVPDVLKRPLIQVLSSETIEDASECDEEECIETARHDDDTVNKLRLPSARYGFNSQFSDVFTNLEEFLFVFDCGQPDVYDPNKRRSRLMKENRDFDIERYLGDLYCTSEDQIYIDAMDFKPHWAVRWDAWNAQTNVSRDEDAFFAGFSTSENEILRNKLTSREYIIPAGSAQYRNLLLDLTDILIAICYDYRITLGEGNVESAHNIVELSAVCSWLDNYDSKISSARDVLVSSLRRALTYPYLRSYKLSRRILEDVTKLFYLGKRSLLKVLLYAHSIFERSDRYYLFNKILIEDFALWIQQQNDENLYAFAKIVNEEKKKIGRNDLGLNLEAIEVWGKTLKHSDHDISGKNDGAHRDEILRLQPHIVDHVVTGVAHAGEINLVGLGGQAEVLDQTLSSEVNQDFSLQSKLARLSL